MSGWKDWAIGEVVTESDFQSFVQDQVVQVYDDATDRDNTLGTAVAEGMVAYLKDTDSTIVYNGTAWIAVGAGDITGVTAGTALTGGGVSGDVTLDVDISALATAHAGNALNANGELLDVDESAITLAQSQVTDLVSDLADKADNADFTGGTAGYTALSNGTAGLSYQPVSHNYIINGAFDIWQRGTSFSGDEFTADRWKNLESGGTSTVTQENFSSGDIEAISFGDAKYFLRKTTTTGADNCGLIQPIEDVRILSGQTVTLSFWAKGTNPGGGDFDASINQRFGSGGSSTVFPSAGKFSVTSSWQRFELTLSMPSVAGKTIGSGSYAELFIRQPGGDNSTSAWTLDIWGVQLEAGSITTPFKRNANNIQGELAACERYCQTVGDDLNAEVYLATGFARFSTDFRAVIPLRTKMRVPPTSFSVTGDLQLFDTTSYFLDESTAQILTNSTNAPFITISTDSGVSLVQTNSYWLKSDGATGGAVLLFEAEL